MTNDQWEAFGDFRKRFKDQCDAWMLQAGGPKGWLAKLQREAASADGNPDYDLETPIVYNRALDGIEPDDDIKLIVVGDNPGKDEQLLKNQRYLVGQAGKLGDGFFRRNPELGIDFRKNAIILNKTPIHTAKTKQLAYISRNGGEKFNGLFAETQRWMAHETALLHRELGCALWLVGYAELRAKGLFGIYASELARENLKSGDVRLYQHFSMNRFSIDLKERYDGDSSLGENLHRIGLAHRREVLGW